MIDREGSREDDDSDLEQLFAPLARELDDAAFTAAVMRHVTKRDRRGAIRLAVLGIAGAVGAAFAVGPVTRWLADALRADGAAVADAYRGFGHAVLTLDVAGAMDPRLLALSVAALSVLAWPLLVRWLAR
jgi:hypothetical protein